MEETNSIRTAFEIAESIIQGLVNPNYFVTIMYEPNGSYGYLK